MTKLQQHIAELLPNSEVKTNYSLSKISFFKVGGDAEVYIKLSKIEDISNVVRYCEENGVKYIILGGASNVVISDEGYDGVVIHLNNNDFEILDLSQGYTMVRAGAGIKMSSLVKKMVDSSLTGLEYFLGVPGTLGGAIYNNAHYLEDLIGEHVESVDIIDSSGNLSTLSNGECHFAYDDSRFKYNKEIIYSVVFKLKLGNEEESRELIKKATMYRASTQPLGVPSSGCIFQNVPNSDELKKRFPQFEEKKHISGGFLIDKAGLKGEKIGGIEVSDKHAAFFINTGNGTSSEVKRLIDKVKRSVMEKFGVELKEEVVYIS